MIYEEARRNLPDQTEEDDENDDTQQWMNDYFKDDDTDRTPLSAHEQRLTDVGTALINADLSALEFTQVCHILELAWQKKFPNSITQDELGSELISNETDEATLEKIERLLKKTGQAPEQEVDRMWAEMPAEQQEKHRKYMQYLASERNKQGDEGRLGMFARGRKVLRSGIRRLLSPLKN